ncbi:MAG: YggS family pyridoxal phosphate-dependent enzyme [Candidatus Binatia bacterium]
MSDVAANWKHVCRQVAEAARRAGRDPRSVRIVAAAKTKPVELIEQAIAAGVTDVGENYVQEAAAKRRRITAPVAWHLLGHLQRNKAARAVELFDLIHTLDSVTLAQALARHGARMARPVPVLIEVNIGAEATKSGVQVAEVEALVRALATQRWLVVHGLMAVPPAGPSPESARRYFRALRVLRDRLRAGAPANAPLRELSMGMTDDFAVAIEEGATIVRVGRAIFGEREKTDLGMTDDGA